MTRSVVDQTISLNIPDIDSMSDDALADFLHLRDGIWSRQTKDMQARFGTSKLNLNRASAGLWQGWSCPCCERAKTQIARVSSAGVLLCQIEMHHDHLGDWAKQQFTRLNPRTEDKLVNMQIDAFKQSMLQLVARFEPTAICLDCNLAEGRAKTSLGKQASLDFSFSPSEITRFITVRDNQVHEFDQRKVEEIWSEVKSDLDDRIDFATRMAKRFANGKNRKQFDGRRSPEFWIETAALFWRMIGQDDARVLSRSNLAEKIVSRSTARDAVGQSAKPKVRRPGRAPTDMEFQSINQQNADQKHWVRFGDDWMCDCCGRSKRSVCRKANSGKWTARIHVMRDWKFSEMIGGPAHEAATSDFHIHDHSPAFICQDCRNVVSEMQRRDDSLNEYSVTLADIRGAISSVADNETHVVDFGYLMDRAHENHGLQEAISSYQELEGNARYYLERANSIMKRHRCCPEEARDHLIQEHAEVLECLVDDATDHIEWYLNRARKFEELRQIELGRAPLESSLR